VHASSLAQVTGVRLCFTWGPGIATVLVNTLTLAPRVLAAILFQQGSAESRKLDPSRSPPIEILVIQ
jgi:hypothetical protein